MLNRRWKLAAVVTACVFALAACQHENPYTGEQETSNTTRGAVIGGAGGAVVGALTHTRGKGAGRNALVGAGIGALAGGVVGHYMDDQENELRDQLRSAGVSVTREGNNIVLNMQNDILFDVSSANLGPRASEIVRQVAVVLRHYRQTYVNVNGFTDTTGSPDYNRRLSQDRAETVAQRLAYFGVEPARISPEGFGERDLRIQTRNNVD